MTDMYYPIYPDGMYRAIQRYVCVCVCVCGVCACACACVLGGGRGQGWVCG